MNILDIILIAAMVLLTARGLVRGLFKEALSLGSLFIGIFVAMKFHHFLEPYIAVHLSNADTVRAASYLATFLITLALIWLIAKVVTDAIAPTPAGWINIALGGLFGLCEGLVLCTAALYVLLTFLPNTEMVKQSSLAPSFRPLVEMFAGQMPEGMRETIEDQGYEPPETIEKTDAES